MNKEILVFLVTLLVSYALGLKLTYFSMQSIVVFLSMLCGFYLIILPTIYQSRALKENTMKYTRN